ncbi:MAG: TIGR00341 family protein, partial [Halioglobus sp.]
ADVLTCNDEVVFSSVVIGRVLALRPNDINRHQTSWSLLRGALKGLGKMRLGSYQVTTGKEREIQLAALGLVALGQTQSTLVERSFSEDLSLSDGRLSVLALAPRSVISYLWFILRLLWPQKISLSQLPGSLGLIQSDRIHVVAPQGAEYLLDGKPVHSSEIELRVLPERLRLLPGPALVPRQEEQKSSDKETVRLNNIPTDDAARPLVARKLPLFSHAAEEDYRELFVALRDKASASSSYQVLMVLSVLLALSGLYANSAPVIIGAMILAPLMSPVVSLAMGLARTEANLIRRSLKTLLVGISWGLACGIILAWVMPLEVPTAEMQARMSPTLLDLLIAVISGIAGAYAHAKEEIAKSLAGVAIAVALVPPLSVAGIGLGWADWGMAGGALLLLITNLVGIALAASATFLVLGFAPFKRARTGLGITLLIMVVISAPLYVAFIKLVHKDRILEQIYAQVPQGLVELSGMVVGVTDIRVVVGDPYLVRVVLSSPERLNETHVDELKKRFSDNIGEPIVLEAQLNVRR